MTVPSQTCKQNVSQSEANMIEEFREAVAKREYLRVLGKDISGLDVALDDVAKTIRDGKTPGSVVPLYKSLAGPKFDDLNHFWLLKINPWMSSHGLPGWDNGLCVVRWRDYACFCNGAAQAYLKSAAALTSYLKQFEGSNVEVKPSSCDARVMEDGFYTQTLGATSRHGPSWWVWGGLLVVGTVLAWPVVFGKKGHVR